MKRVRLTIKHNPEDSAEDLRYAFKVRRDLWEHSLVEIDSDSPLGGIYRDADRNAYFEFVTDSVDQAEGVLVDGGHTPRTRLTVVAEDVGPECLNCGHNNGPILPTVCPVCGFRDISPCPHCHREIPRQSYRPFGSAWFTCPSCGGHVRLQLRDPLVDDDGHYNQPLVHVEVATEAHEVR
jgi:hypothetical protein